MELKNIGPMMKVSILAGLLCLSSVGCMKKHDFATGGTGTSKLGPAGSGEGSGTQPGGSGTRVPGGSNIDGGVNQGQSPVTGGPGSGLPGAGGPGSGLPGAGGPGGEGGSGGTIPGSGGVPNVYAGSGPIPQVLHGGPECLRQSQCTYHFKLAKAMEHALVFNWRTHDELHMTLKTKEDMVVAIPNHHYIPNSGVVTFAPGETEKTVYIQNINPENVKLYIPVRMSNCVYNGIMDPGGCKTFFY